LSARTGEENPGEKLSKEMMLELTGIQPPLGF